MRTASLYHIEGGSVPLALINTITITQAPEGKCRVIQWLLLPPPTSSPASLASHAGHMLGLHPTRPRVRPRSGWRPRCELQGQQGPASTGNPQPRPTVCS